ncbi:uncharacterized protein LOC144420957 [Styela clava]
MAASYSEILNRRSGNIPPQRDKRVREIRRPHCLHIQFSKEDQFEDGIRNAAKSIVLKCLNKIHVNTIAVRPYNSVDITCNSRAAVLQLATFLEDEPHTILKWHLYEPKLIKVNISWIPGYLTTNRVKTALLEYVKFDSDVNKSKDKNGIGKGTMNVKISPKSLQENPIPSYIFVNRYMLAVHYYGQKKTCKQCGSIDHFKIDCPIRLQNRNLRQSVQKPSKISSPNYAPTQEENGSECIFAENIRGTTDSTRTNNPESLD